jgi:hypothetical protein
MATITEHVHNAMRNILEKKAADITIINTHKDWPLGLKKDILQSFLYILIKDCKDYDIISFINANTNVLEDSDLNISILCTAAAIVKNLDLLKILMRYTNKYNVILPFCESWKEGFDYVSELCQDISYKSITYINNKTAIDLFKKGKISNNTFFNLNLLNFDQCDAIKRYIRICNEFNRHDIIKENIDCNDKECIKYFGSQYNFIFTIAEFYNTRKLFKNLLADKIQKKIIISFYEKYKPEIHIYDILSISLKLMKVIKFAENDCDNLLTYKYNNFKIKHLRIVYGDKKYNLDWSKYAPIKSVLLEIWLKRVVTGPLVPHNSLAGKTYCIYSDELYYNGATSSKFGPLKKCVSDYINRYIPHKITKQLVDISISFD